MDQLVVLQEIYESFAKGNDSLHKIDAKSITGNCAPQISKLLDSIVQGETDKDVCLKLAQCLTDLYELKRLGDICRRAGLLDVAIICYNKSLSSSKDTQVRSVLMNNLGQVYVRKGDLSRAVLYYKKAVEGFEAVGDNGGTAHVLGNLGSAYRRAYDWDKSVASFFKSLKLFEKAGDELGAAQMTGSLGRVYAEMGELDLAVLYFERSLKEFEGLGDKRSAAWVLNRLGKVKAESRNWDGSEGAFNRSLALFDEIGQPHNSGTVLSNLGRMYLDKGELNRARDSLERSLQLIRRDMLPVYPNTLSCLGATYAALAKDHWQGADEDEILKPRRTDKDQKEALNLASKLYTHAADSLTDLSQHSKVFLPDVKISASIARSLSYLVLLLNNPRDEEAVSLAKRAISAMQEASANSEGAEKDKLEALKRTLMGTMGIWSIGLLKNEPWGMIKTLGESVEYLMGGGRALSSAEGRISPEAFRSISLALQDLSSALEADRQRCGSGD
jgi:tetratricopeptide (TPR) repeat protein